MDERLHIVRLLYGEGGDPAELRRLLEDEALRAEYQALSEAKFHLDHRRRVRPAPAVIDRILAAAAHPERLGATPPLRPERRDRAARPGPRRRAARWAGIAFVLTLLLGGGVYFLRDGTQAGPPALTEAPGARQGGGSLTGPESTRSATGLQVVSAPDDVLRWDAGEDVARLHRRIERLRNRNADLQWGEPAVPLEMLPGTYREAGIQPAATRLPGGQ